MEIDNYCFRFTGKIKRDIKCGNGNVYMNISGKVETIKCLTSFTDRLQGLLFKEKDGLTRLFVPCNNIHTYGMTKDIDIAFIDRNGIVIEVVTNMSPKRKRKNKEACVVAERFSSAKPWLLPGDKIHFVPQCA